jgi:hypothetical protein
MNQAADENPYKSPVLADAAAETRPEKALPDTKEIFQAIFFAVVQQIIIAILFALILDGGQLLQRWLYAIAASWTLSSFILVRHFLRLSKPITAVDIAIIKGGVWLAMLLVFVCEIIIVKFLL